MTDLKKHIIIGGSAGSFQTVVKITENIKRDFPFAIFLVLHRLKSVKTGFVEALSTKNKLKLIEPYDKEMIVPGTVYLAPSNYHLYIEYDGTISLSTEETVNHSRPSIDITFSSAAASLGDRAIGILLSGANADGAQGLYDLHKAGSMTIVQSPDEAQIPTMPQAALNLFKPDKVYTSDAIINFVTKLVNYG